MQPPSAHGGRKPRSQSPSVVIKKPSIGQAWTDEGHFPRHYDRTWRHAVRKTTELDAIKSLKVAWNAQQGTLRASGYSKKPLYIDASDYEIYTLPENNFFGELHSLDYIDLAGKKLLFSGVLSTGDVRYYVQDVPVKSYSIEGYGVDDDPNTTVYIVSSEASRDREYDVWYKLGSPSRQYKRFQDAFQWVATLGKHVIDFLEDRESVGLADLRQNFSQFLHKRYPRHPDLIKWHEAYGSIDFRKVVHAHISYLWAEAMCLQNDTLLQNHPLWNQCGRSDDDMIKLTCAKTVATPHVYKCFKNRYFAGQLMKMQPSDAVRAAREHRMRALGLPSETRSVSSSAGLSPSAQHRHGRYKVGDVVSIAPDEFENQMWRKTAKDVATVHEWLGYVQRVALFADGRQRLYVIWLYRPEDTTISTTDYPVPKELFMSDNCNCQEDKLMSSDVIRRYSVEWFSRGYDTHKDFLARQKFNTETSSFITMKEEDFQCTCCSSRSDSSAAISYAQGDTVYVCDKEFLQPVVIEENNTAARTVKVRRLVRLRKIQTEAFYGTYRRAPAANELAWTEYMEVVPYARIGGKCFVRYFSRKEVATLRVEFPYNQEGAGHCWILSMRFTENGQKLEDLITAPRPLREGPDYSSHDSSKKLPGLSLFSGLGNLDKGLEAGGAVHFHTSVDMNGRAIQTLRANAEDADQLKLWFGSVDDYLHALLSGNSSNTKLVAKIGNVGVIAAGSPCPGFSKLQQDWQSEQSLRNAAHVTTFASFVDVYRPEYGFLENVVNMGAIRKGFEEELVLSQLVGCLVSMGYQVQQFIMSSWNYGSPQLRNRLIISITAPGRTPIVPPLPTHRDPEGFSSKSVGKLLNGERFGVQDAQLTPFSHFTAGEALQHLPNIGSGIKHPCIRYPDHVLRVRPNIKERRCMAHIPTYPPGVGLEYAAKHGLIPKYLYETKSEINGKSYRRIKKDGLIGTIVTAPSPHDSRAGPFVHWEQNRCITLEEARLGQGIPPEEVLIGNVADQYKMVGNAVDRRVSKALGLELRRAVDLDDVLGKVKVERQSVSVIINVKRQSTSSALNPTTESYAQKEPATRVPSSSDEDTDMELTSDITQATNEVTPTTSPPELGAEASASASSRRKSSHKIELEAQLEADFSFDLRLKPGGKVINDDLVEFDRSTTAPALALSCNGFPSHVSNTLSAVPSPHRSVFVSTPEPSTPTSADIPASTASESPDPINPELPLRTKRPRLEIEAASEGYAHSHSRDLLTPSKRIRQLPQSELAETPTVSINPGQGVEGEPSRKPSHGFRCRSCASKLGQDY